MSISQEGISIVVLTFDWNQDMAEARTDINQKIELVPLPEGASKPTVMKFDPTMLPVMEISITHTKETDLPELTILSEKTLKPRIEGIEGVASVDMLGVTNPANSGAVGPCKTKRVRTNSGCDSRNNCSIQPQLPCGQGG